MIEYKITYYYNDRRFTDIFFAENEFDLDDKLASIGIYNYVVGWDG